MNKKSDKKKQNKTHILDASKNDSFAGAPSFSFRHRLLRASFAITWFLLARWTPPPFHRWRIIILNLFGAKIHPTATIHSSVRVWYPPNLAMHKYSCLGAGVICYSMDKITIGERAVISQRSHLCAGTHDIESENFQLITKPIHIGAKAWITSEAFVGPGVSVGEGAVLGARGVATKDLEAWTVYAGNPAKSIKNRKIC